MAHESMLRTLQWQLEAVWPQESPILSSYDLPAEAAILDVGCGPGYATRRIARLFDGAAVVGVELDSDHVRRAQEVTGDLGGRVRVIEGDAFDLPFESRAFDLVLCRHVLQSIPDADAIVREMARVARPDGYLHIVAEDYGMMHFYPTALDTDAFFARGPIAFGAALGTDLRIGRRIAGTLAGLDLTDVRVEYLVLDTIRTARSVLIGIWEAWRDGYSEAIASHTDLSLDDVHRHWEEMLDCLRSPHGYAVWLLPVATARVPVSV